MTRAGATNTQAIDLFCGAGGLTCGLQQAGIDVRLGADSDPACQYPFDILPTDKSWGFPTQANHGSALFGGFLLH